VLTVVLDCGGGNRPAAAPLASECCVEGRHSASSNLPVIHYLLATSKPAHIAHPQHVGQSRDRPHPRLGLCRSAILSRCASSFTARDGHRSTRGRELRPAELA